MTKDGRPVSEAIERQIPRLSRRNLIKISATGAAAIAGCSGQQNDQEATPTNGGGGTTQADEQNEVQQLINTQFVRHAGERQAETHYNRFNPTAQNTDAFDHIFDQIAWKPLKSSLDWRPGIATEWSFNSDKLVFSVELREQNWHNGEPITAEDLAIQWRLNKYIYPSSWADIDKVSTDDRTFKVHFSNPVNQKIIYNDILNYNLTTPRFVYQEWLDKFEEAEGDDEKVKEIKGNLTQWRWEPKDVVGNSGWKLLPDQLTEFSAKLKAVPEHRAVDPENGFNFQYLYLTRPPKGNEGPFTATGKVHSPYHPQLIAQDLSGLDVNEAWPKVPIGTLHQSSLVFQFNNELYQDKRVRWALAHALDYTQWNELLESHPGEAYPHDHPTAIPGQFQGTPDQQWIGEDLENFRSYNGGQERAAELLREAGFNKQDDQWMKPDGSPYSMTLHGYPPLKSHWEIAANMLQQFGIQASVQMAPETQYWGTTIPDSDFEHFAGYWIGGNDPFPLFAYQSAFDVRSSPGVKEYFLHQEELTVPEPFDPDGPEKTFNLGEKLAKLEQTTDPEIAKRHIKEFAWIYNQYMPAIPVFEQVLPYGILGPPYWSTPEPGSDDWYYQWPGTYMETEGLIQKIPENEGGESAPQP